jgi:vacuolar-type H+-ATPase subunit E/Vma4
MADTIEAFVEKLQKEGVLAGQDAAERLLAKAQKEAEAILAEAKAKAKQITDEADAQARNAQTKSQADLELAARDTVLRLREALRGGIRRVLAEGAKQALTDGEFLRGLLNDIVLQYIRADLQKKTTLQINVSPETRKKLADWAAERLARDPKTGGAEIDLKDTLAEAGFEYRLEGGHVEVTVSSVVDVLSELVTPALRDMLKQAMAPEK